MRAAMIAVVRMLASLLKRHEPTSGTDNMKKMLILLTVAMATVANAQAQVILHGFSGAGEPSAGVRIDHGRLRINAEKRTCSHTLADGLALQRFAIDFKARFRCDPTDHHFGVILYGDNGKRLMLFTRKASVGCLTDKEPAGCSVGDIRPELQSGGSDWAAFKIVVDSDFVEVNINRQLVGSVTYDIAPVRRIEFYASRVELEVADCTVARLAELKPQPTDSQGRGGPDFHATFDGNASAVSASGTRIAPLRESGLRFVEGIKGRAVYIGTAADAGKKKAPRLQYDARKLFDGPSGTVCFWFQPDWDGAAGHDWRFLLTGADEQVKNIFNFWFWEWLRVDLPRKELSSAMMNRRFRSAVFRGDWMHLALVWQETGWTRLFVDGIPYRHGGPPPDELPVRLTSLDMRAIRTFCVGSGVSIPPQQNGGGAFDDLKIYRRALSDDEVVAEYRRFMPVDMVMDRTTLLADKDETVAMLIAPGGHYVRPAVATQPPRKADVELTFELTDNESGRAQLTKQMRLTVETAQSLRLPVGRLAPGMYRLKCQIRCKDSTVQKTFMLKSYLPASPQTASSDDVVLGKPIYVKDFGKDGLEGILHEGPITLRQSALGRYVEAGPEAGPNGGERMGVEVAFPEKYRNGKPVLLEIEWPDDKPRAMACYMYPAAASPQHRDRLEGGIQSGREYPLTHKTQKTRYLFYPGVDRYLFEARTVIKGFPAALCRLKVFPVENERLPKLKIEYPAGMPHRVLGNLDEDQTVHIVLNYDDAKERASPHWQEKVIDRWCDYCEYTGQSVTSEPVLRYGYVLYSLAGHYEPGATAALIDLFGRRGMSVIPIVNFWTLPELALTPEKKKAHVQEGDYAIRSDGYLSGDRMNILNPAIRQAFVRHVQELAERYGRMQGCGGIELWPVGTYLSLNEGYDDATVSRFSKQTGVPVPEGPGDKCQARYRFLTGPGRAKWLRWRADQTTQLIKAIEQTIHAVNPGLDIYLTLQGKPTAGSNEDDTSADLDTRRYYYEACGLDFDAVQALPKVYCTPLRMCTDHRWHMHWRNPESTAEESLYDFRLFRPFVKDGVAFSNSYLVYFESFRGSLNQAIYKGYFQNADVKPFGRYFLKELVYSLAMMDAQRILIGAQPPGTWGREQETREFAQAYCALPALPFTDLQGMTDPITVRYRNTNGGTYVYVANLLWSDCSATLRLAPAASVRDLSTGKNSASAPDGSYEIRLRPYQLRSFLIGNGNAVPSKVAVAIPASVSQFYVRRLDALQASLAAVPASDVRAGRFKARLAEIRRLLSAGQYAEAHRLVFSKLMNALTNEFPSLRNGQAASTE